MQLIWFIKLWMYQLESWWYFWKNCFGFQHVFSSLIILLTNSWSLLQRTLAEIVHVPLIVANSICLFLTAFSSYSHLSYTEIKLHTSTFITETLHWNYITYWDQEIYYSRKMKLLLSWMSKYSYILSHFFSF